MKVTDCLGYLVDYAFFVHGIENVLAYDPMQVCLHVFEQEIDVFVIFCSVEAFEANYVGMIELPEEHYFSKSSLRISRMLKSVKNLFKGQNFPCTSILHLPDMAISSRTQFLDDFITPENVCFNLFRHL